MIREYGIGAARHRGVKPIRMIFKNSNFDRKSS